MVCPVNQPGDKIARRLDERAADELGAVHRGRARPRKVGLLDPPPRRADASMMAGRRERPRGRRKDRDEDSIDGSASTATEGPANALPAYVPPPTPPGRTRLGDLLVSEGSISSERLADALLQQATSGERLGSVLVAAGALTESSLTSALARQLGLPKADLGSETPHPDAVALLPADLARASAVVPLRIDADGALVVAAADPTPETLSRVATAAGREVRAFL